MITKEEELQLIEAHLRSLYSRNYSLQLDSLTENAVQNPSLSTLQNIQQQLDSIALQIAALMAEKTSVEAE